MKTFAWIVVILCCCTSVAFADEWQGLSLQARENVQLQTREMSALGIPEAQAQTMLTLMVRNRFAEKNMVRARQVVMDAARAGLPTEPVMSKAMEGMAKQVREQQIIAAMETVRNRYAYAEQMARSLSTEKKNVEAMRNAIADSLAAGMQTANLEAVRTQLQTQTQTRQQTRNRAEDDALAVQTMQTVRTMARLGINSPEIADILNQAIRNTYTHREMEQLRLRIATNSPQESPGKIASRYAGSISKSDGPVQAGGTGSDSGDSGNFGSGGSGSGNGGSDSSGSGNGGSGNGGSGGSGSGGSGSGSGGSGGSGSGGSGSGSGGSVGSGSGGSGSGSGGSGGSGSGSGGSGGSGSGNGGSGGSGSGNGGSGGSR
jgi:hypothetical protein